MFLLGASLSGGMLLLPLSFQKLRGVDALGSELLLIPQDVGSLLARSLAGRLTDRFGARWVAIGGFAVMLIAAIPFAFAFAFADGSTSPWWIGAVLVVRGLGLGAVMIPIRAVGFSGLDRSDMPHASTMTRLSQQLGGAFGTAILAVTLSGAVSGSDPAEGLQIAFWWAIGITAVATAVAVVLPGRPAEETATRLAADPQRVEASRR